MCGYGRIIFLNGDYYEGEFKDNKANGIGKQVTSSGHTYEGQWINDK